MLSSDITSVVDMWVTGTDLKTNAFHSLFFFHVTGEIINTINLHRRKWTQVELAEWNGIYRLF